MGCNHCWGKCLGQEVGARSEGTPAQEVSPEESWRFFQSRKI